jgi:leucyl/phenylalanyl-tRNA--protein transferase
MPIIQLTESLFFPPVEWAEEDGLLAIGGDLSPERLLLAYRSGIFPWYNEKPMLWWSPDPRFVLFPHEVIVSHSMKKILSRGIFEITINQAFSEVMARCASAKRAGEQGTWISKDFIKNYTILHEMGHAHSVEAWQGGKLVGGLYGVKIHKCFCGESMFSDVTNASKAAFLSYISQAQTENIDIIDCQIYTEHLASLGAKMIPRKEFVKYLSERLPTPKR